MKTPVEEFKSPYLDSELELIVPTQEGSHQRAQAINERLLLQKTPLPTTHPTIVSTFEQGLEQKLPRGLIRRALSKLGVLSGLDDCTYFERKLNSSAGAKLLRYVAVELRARPAPRGSAEMKKLIKLLDECIVANNP